MMTNTYLPHVGGVARSVSTFAEEYRRRKHRVLIVAPEMSGKPLPARAAAMVERVPAIQKFNGSDFSIRLPILGLPERIQNFDADIIHAHHPFLLGDTALRIAASKNIPVIFTHHTRYEDYTHYVPFDSPVLKDMAISLSTRFANLCDGVIAPSESIAALILRRGVEVPIKVVPTGIDVNLFAGGDGARFRARHGLPARAFVVGHVGRLAPEKNLDYLARAVAIFLSRTPGAYFMVVGSGPSEEALKRVFVEFNLTDKLVLAGGRTGQALADAYHAMDVFVFASFTETQGLVLAEAMAAGCPAIALQAPGVREVVRNRENGYLLPKTASPRRFAGALTRLYKAPYRRAAFARNAQATAESFSREHCADTALQFYEEIRRLTRKERLLNERSPWGVFTERIGVEWNLLAEKAQAVAEALSGL